VTHERSEGLAPGWTNKGEPASAEEIAANWQQIHEPGEFIVPMRSTDAMKAMMAALAD